MPRKHLDKKTVLKGLLSSYQQYVWSNLLYFWFFLNNSAVSSSTSKKGVMKKAGL